MFPDPMIFGHSLLEWWSTLCATGAVLYGFLIHSNNNKPGGQA